MGSRRIQPPSNYRNPCLTMHQPWASLLVYGIKRIEGRSWPAPIRGRLWIHAASKVPEPETIKAMEDFYREIYAANGIQNVQFPEHYPVSRLLGCVDVVGCVTGDELGSWEDVPTSVRLEGQTAFCWLCEQPQKLIVPFEMRGYQGVYNLERKIYESAIRGLTSVKSPLPVRFSLPNPRDLFSLKPGSLASRSNCPSVSEEDKPPNLVAAIAGARAAATQFSKNHTSQLSGRDNIDDQDKKSISSRTAATQRSKSHTSQQTGQDSMDDQDRKSISSRTAATQRSNSHTSQQTGQDNMDDQDKKPISSRTRNSLQLVERNRIYESAVRGLASDRSPLPSSQTSKSHATQLRGRNS